MGEIQIHPTVEQKTSYLISESIRGGGAILVNQQGTVSSMRWKLAIKSRRQSSHCRRNTRISSLTSIRAKTKAADEYIAKGFMTSASSQKPPPRRWVWITASSATLERYNGFVEKQHDDDFGRTTALRAPINEGPFYAIRLRRACTTPWAA